MRFGPSYAFAKHHNLPENFGELERDAETTRLIDGNTAFALDLFRMLGRQETGNLVISPCSISQSLGMLTLGAAGRTAEQLSNAMRLPRDSTGWAPAFRRLNDSLMARGNVDARVDHVSPPRALHSANGLWGDLSLRFDPAYCVSLERSFGATPHSEDFRNEPTAARAIINSWVAHETRKLIQEIVPPGGIASDTRLVLLNALYFYGAWEYLFKFHHTQRGDFNRRDGTRIPADFMRLEESLPYARGDGFQAVDFPYFGSQFTFTVVLPDTGRFENFETGLDANLLGTIVTQLTDRRLTIFLPKFRFDFATSLVGPLLALGVTDAFDSRAANFAAMMDPSHSERAQLSEVLHKTVISIDEEGTEAAGATLEVRRFGGSPHDPLEIRVDRPFVFLIRDAHTSTLLFLGRVMDPGNSTP